MKKGLIKLFVLLYFFLKTRGVLLVLPDFLDLNQLRYADFTTDYKYLAKIYPEFNERDKKFIIKEYITTILENLDLNEITIRRGLTLFDHFYPLIQHAKEEVVAAIICVLTKMLYDVHRISTKDIFEKAGVEQSSLYAHFRGKIFPYLSVPDGTTLKHSSKAIKAGIRYKFPSFEVLS